MNLASKLSEQASGLSTSPPVPPNPEPIERNLSYFFPPQLIYIFFITTGFFLCIKDYNCILLRGSEQNTVY